MLHTIGIGIDIFIVASLIIYGIVGIKKGLFRSLIGLFTWSVCLIVALFLAKYVAVWINGIHNFSADIGTKIADGLNNSNEFFLRTINSFSSREEIIESIPNGTNFLLKQLMKIIFTKSEINMESDAQIGTIVGSGLGFVCMIIISAILIFIVLKLVLFILGKIFDKLSKVAVIGGLNKILGFVFGLLRACVSIISFNMLLIGLSMVPFVRNTIEPLVQDNTHVEKVAYEVSQKFIDKTILDEDAIINWTKDIWQS